MDETTPSCFVVYPRDLRTVAGYNCDSELWFVYPVENGKSVIDENKAVFFAGKYNFWDWEVDAKAVFDDLEQKLTKVYGDPFLKGSSLDEVLGTVDELFRG